MKYGKVRKYDLEVVEKYDGKEGIFKAQHSLIPMILHVLVQTKILLFYGFLWFCICWFLWRQHCLKIEGSSPCESLHTLMTKLPLT